ncbi:MULTISPECIES: F0F1 ATP synthase subunit B [Roseibium]|uniref:ATP synthase subunit b n=1 Tax=Roseibium polysiphoniae TaxID=2571221 RepID=A0A944CEG1_9HYPH|nr:F0F1 ATP synthase subunit B [Roseibium polysiphoniae]MBD8877973.1 F0F1 ATP synthase subunit B [Roseibium polysiphoniae]MBS8261328.1 ATP F0F1 synthase subunit B' [Roseibium polysiphoniae]
MASQTHSTTEGTHEVIEVPPGEHGAGFPPFDSSTFASQILWLAITFGLFYWIMKNVAVPRIAGILEDRKDRIAGDLAEANRLKQETDAAIAAYEQALAEARNKAHGIAHDTRAKLKAENEARREKAETELAEKLAAAETHIAGIKTEALSQIGDIAGETTTALVEVLMGKAPTKTDLTKALKSAMN